MRHYMSKFKGYKFIIRPRRRKVVDGNLEFIDGLHAKFVEGRFSTDNPEIIKALDQYSKSHPEEITMVGEPKNMEEVVKNALNKMDEKTKKGIIEAIKKQASEDTVVAENEVKKQKARQRRTKVQTEGQ